MVQAEVLDSRLDRLSLLGFRARGLKKFICFLLSLKSMISMNKNEEKQAMNAEANGAHPWNIPTWNIQQLCYGTRFILCVLHPRQVFFPCC